ncbi:MAG: terminase small subunit [Candidatus Izemoplasmatales bacterium]
MEEKEHPWRGNQHNFKQTDTPRAAQGDADKNLTKLQKAFVEEYISNDFNVAEAGRKIYTKSPKSAHKWAWETFRLPHVKKEIERRVQEKLHDQGFSKDSIIQEWLRMAKSDIADFIEWDFRLNEETHAYEPIIHVRRSEEVDTKVMKSVKVGRNGKLEFEMYDKQQALKQLGELMGIYPKTSQVEVVGKDGGAIQIEDVRSKLLERLNKISGRTGDDESQPESTVPERDDG